MASNICPLFYLLLYCYIAAGLVCTVSLGSQSHGTHDHVLLSDGSGSHQTAAQLTRISYMTDLD
jgi:hypothetical protein